MEQYNNRGRPSPSPPSSSLWTNALPYNALSEEGSYGSFALYTPSPLPSPMHLSASSYPAKDPPGPPFPSRNDQNSRLSAGHLTRSISSTEGLRRHRRPLSELLSAPEGPPSPLPAASVHRRPSLSSLMASSLDFDRPPRLDEDVRFPLHSHTRRQSASSHLPLFPHAGVHYNLRASHSGFLPRASSDRFDLDPMIRSSFDQQDYHSLLDPTLTPLLPTYHSNGSSRKGEPAMVGGHIMHEVGGVISKDNLISEHSYKKMQYLRSRSNIKSQDVNAPLSPLSSHSARQVKQTDHGLYDANARKRATMRDMLAHTDVGLQQDANMPHPPPPQVPFQHRPHDNMNGASRFSFERYNAPGVPATFDHRYHAQNPRDENHHLGLHDPPLYVKSYGVAAQTPPLDQNGGFIRDPASQEQGFKGSARPSGHEQGKVLMKNLSTQEEGLVNTYYDPMREAKPRWETNWSAPTNMASHDATDSSKPLHEMRTSSDVLDGHSGRKNVDKGSYLKVKQHTDNGRKDCVLTKGQSILDNVTENIVRKLASLSNKYRDQPLPEGATSSARLLFKRALLVQIQALAPKLTEICAEEKEVAAHSRWALQESSIMSASKQVPLSHPGLCLLHLQKILYDVGTSTFDILMKIRPHLHIELLIKPSIMDESSGQLMRIACIGGAPGCAAIALRLFFMLVRPSWEMHVDILGANEQSKRIVEELSFIDIKCTSTDGGGIRMVRRDAGTMRCYKMLMVVNCMGELEGKVEREQWKSTLDELYENAAVGAVVVVYESVAPTSKSRWEDIAPSMAPWQFASPPALQDCVRVGQKHY